MTLQSSHHFLQIFLKNYHTRLDKLDVSNFDTSNVTDMSSMFDGCESLQKLDVSNFDTSNVTDMYGMFYNCSSLQELDVSNFDTSNVTDMSAMFFSCTALKNVYVSNKWKEPEGQEILEVRVQ